MEFFVYRVPEDSSPKSVVIDKETYGRLLKSCNFKSKDALEREKEQKEQEQNRLMVS